MTSEQAEEEDKEESKGLFIIDDSTDSQAICLQPTIKPYKNRHLIVQAKAKQVLVVDDEPLNIEILCGMLEARGVMTDHALGGTQAIALFQKRIEQFKSDPATCMYKLVLLDYSMPDMDGPEVATEIQKLFKEHKIK